MRPGVRVMYVDQVLWMRRERATAINHRELPAVLMALSRSIRKRLANPLIPDAVIHNDNQSVVQILNAFVSAILSMMAELMQMKQTLKPLNIFIYSERLPSAFNRFADSLSQRLLAQDLQVLPRLRRYIEAGLQAPHNALPISLNGR